MNTRHLKLLLITSLCCSFFDLQAQRRLTNREIYNFQVGDVIHFSHYSSFEGFSRHFIREFQSKSYSIDQDSVTFVVLDSIYELVSAPYFKLTVRFDTITYVNLDSFPSPSIDDSTFDNCGTTMYYANYSINRPGVPYTELYSDSYMESLGRYYLYVIDSDNTRREYSTLKYYKTKVRECGVPYRNFKLVELKYNTKIDIEIFPNPAGDFIKVNGITQGQYKLFDQLGRVIQNGEFEEKIDISSLNPGIYFVEIVEDNFIYSQKIIKN